MSPQLERWQCLAGVHARAATRGGEGERLLAALLDLATLTRVLGRLAPALLAGDMLLIRIRNIVRLLAIYDCIFFVELIKVFLLYRFFFVIKLSIIAVCNLKVVYNVNENVSLTLFNSRIKLAENNWVSKVFWKI